MHQHPAPSQTLRDCLVALLEERGDVLGFAVEERVRDVRVFGVD
jgi:hypothetical protein